jgi:hypothetical protein
MKSIGSRKEVYYGLAKKTSGGMTKNDIIKSSNIQHSNTLQHANLQENNKCILKKKKIYLSKKISNRMKHTSPLIIYRNRRKNTKKSDCYNLNVSDLKDKLVRERYLERLKRRKLKSIRKKNKHKNQLSKKLCFVPNKNKIRTYHCKEMFKTTSFSNPDGYESDNENSNTEFKIEDPPEISLEELFL